LALTAIIKIIIYNFSTLNFIKKKGGKIMIEFFKKMRRYSLNGHRNNNHLLVVKVLVGNTYKRGIIVKEHSPNFYDVLLEDGRLFQVVSRERIKI
jgi:hypothetical protein